VCHIKNQIHFSRCSQQHQHHHKITQKNYIYPKPTQHIRIGETIPVDELIDEITTNQSTHIKYNNYLYFYSYTPHNLFLIKKITEIENRIIEYYKAFYRIHKKTSCSLSNLLNNGRIKLYKEDDGNMMLSSVICKKPKVVLKISGVWETNNEVGLTYKFVEMQEFIFT